MHNTARLIAIAFLTALAAQSTMAATEIRIRGDERDRYIPGQSFVLTDANGSITISKGYREGFELFWEDGAGSFWFQFEGIDGTQVVPGIFENAQRPGAQDPGNAGLSILRNQTGCTATGNFRVYEIEYDASGIPTKLAIDASLFCTWNTHGMHAELRVNSDVVFDYGVSADAIDDFNVLPASPVSLGLSQASSTTGTISTYSWTQISGVPVTLMGANTDTASFIAPAVSGDQEVLDFLVTVTDSAGESGTDVVSVVVSNYTLVNSRFLLTTPAKNGNPGSVREEDIDATYVISEPYLNRISFRYNLPDGTGFALTIGGAFDEPLQPGQYDVAHNRDRPFNKPYLNLGYGNSCSYSVGEFNLLDVGYAKNGEIKRLVLDAYATCGGRSGLPPNAEPAHVRIRYNSVIPINRVAPTADAGADRIALHGDVVALDAYASRDDLGTIQSFSWQQLSGPTVNLADADSSLATFTAPDVPQGQGLAEFELTVVNDAGLSESESVMIDIRGSDDPRSVVTLEILPIIGEDGITPTVGAFERLDNNSGHLFASSYGSHTEVDFERFHNWSFDFGPDGGVRFGVPGLAPGVYLFTNINTADFPHMNIDATLAVNCGRGGGSFVVHEIVLDAAGETESFAVDFSMDCGSNGRMTGKVRINSTVPLEAPGLFATAGQDLEAVPGQLVELDARDSYIGPTNGVTYEWVQVSGPPVVVNDAGQAVAHFSAPGSAGVAVFMVTITTAEGLSDTAVVTVNLPGSGIPITAAYFYSETGDYVGLGSTHYFDQNDYRYNEFKSPGLDMIFGSRLTLSGPDGDMLAPGDYRNAFGFGIVPTWPGLDLQLEGRNCEAAMGWFRIYELEPTADQSSADKLAVDFWQSCGPGIPPIYGALRLNSEVPLRTESPVVTAGQNLIGRTGTDVQLDASRSFTWNSTLTGFNWTQVSGPAAIMTGANTAIPTISLPPVTGQSQQLIFEVTAINSFGKQGTARSAVTVLSADEPWSELQAIRFDPLTREEIDTYYFGPNNAFFNKYLSQTDSSFTAIGKDISVRTSFSSRDGDLRFAPGFYHHYYRYSDFASPQIAISFDSIPNCRDNDIKWLDVNAVELDENGLVSTIAFEMEGICAGSIFDGIGIRISGRLNAVMPIDYGNPKLIEGPDRTVNEGSTVYINDAIGYLEGELEDFAGWQQLSGPPVRFARFLNARTAIIGPPVSGDDVVMLRLLVKSKSGQEFSRDVRLDVVENGIGGFPADMITMHTPPGDFFAVGGTLGIESDHLVILEPRVTSNLDHNPDWPSHAPYGALAMEFDTEPGETISVTIHFDAPVDDRAAWWRHWTTAQFYQVHTEPWSLAPDLKSITIELTDGGLEDWDLEANGRIITSGGIAWDINEGVEPPPIPPPPPRPPPQPSGSGGGSTGFAWLVLMTTMIARRRFRLSTGKFLICTET